MITFIFILATVWFGLEFIRDLVNLVLMLLSRTDEVLSVVLTMLNSAVLAVVLLVSPELVTHICLSVVLLIRIVDEYPRSRVPDYLETVREFRRRDTN